MRSAVNRWQQRGRRRALIVGVWRKYNDDRGGQLAAVIAYYGFLSLFPLLLMAVTVLGYLLAGDPSLQHRLLHSAIADFPVIGDQLRSNIHPLRGHGIGVVVALLGLLWGSLGVTRAAQSVMTEVWGLPPQEAPGLVPSVLRGAALLALLAGATALASFASVITFGSAPWVAAVGSVVVTTILNVGLYLGAFRLLTPAEAPTRDLFPGAILGGIGWEILQLAGGFLVGHELRHATAVYGTFGIVLGLVGWLALVSQLLVYAAELNVVIARHLWPVDL